MKICGVIAEYNPFHEGHKYHLAQARKLTGADALIVVMSGHFVQRGEPAIFSPYVRAESALRGGADAVFMMPPEASTASAEGFAEYGVGLLDKLGCDFISCGLEPEYSGHRIAELGKMMACESDDFRSRLKECLKKGISYPDALAQALGIEKLEPNALLAAEYVKAMTKAGSRMEFVPVTRTGSGYEETEIKCGEFPSAMALRKKILSGEIPYEYNGAMPLGPDDFLPEITDSILRCDDFAEFLDVDESIAARLRRSELHYHTFEEMIKDIKTREYTYTRIARAVCHIYLNIKECKKDIDIAHLIGFGNSDVLSELKNRSGTEIISKAADFREELISSAFAATLYNQIYWKKYHIELPNFYRQNIIKV
ncbi:MAG: nucleotidyltransferase family protein [Lachnospiraceae bacterium]|nr:nucleotidyltransferase family protein [Lachnospiraceae bacterium]